MNSLDLASEILANEIGKTISGKHPLFTHDQADILIKNGALIKESIKVPCIYCQEICQVKRQGKKNIAYHSDNGNHHFEVMDEETYHYRIDYEKFLKWFIEKFFEPDYKLISSVRKSSIIIGLLEHTDLKMNLILVPKQKKTTTGELYEWLGASRNPMTSLIVAQDYLPVDCHAGIRLLSGGYSSICQLNDFGKTELINRVIKDCLFRAGIESTLSNLKTEAIARMDFGLDVAEFHDEAAIQAKMLDSIRFTDWQQFEKLSRYAIMSLIPMPLTGYGHKDFGRLPDSIGMLPDNKGNPEHIVLFDAKAILSQTKDCFTFKADDKNKYGDYAESADRLGEKLRFVDIIMLFIAPDYSTNNLIAFSDALKKECKKRGITRSVGCLFVTYDALFVLFKIATDSVHGTVFKSIDPLGHLQRTIFNPIAIKNLILYDKNPDPMTLKLMTHDVVIINRFIVEKRILKILGVEGQYDQYFTSYRNLIHGDK